ncbi:MAG TPA: hypothetical protein VFH89_04245 [Sphingomicrobium sp.]|nr:hypothetical protein [Sphingomicrobium sp.]
MKKRDYLKDGYVNAAVIIFIVTTSWPIGSLLDGKPFVPGLFTVTYYAAVFMLCLVLLLVGVRRVRSQISG